ncbi:hypothetical protein T310_4544 [Rasamsonia emersonii CBS 393.64]|uniref:Major facilitator superfamily (MFS) profile domain-containing protein n=1 Tax=Rasamsonia emersonii (strain ATCC 16479 / CBS 393.64 / IMI 116815) TaxID=1408163 RepID=A0A0F4YUW5_RASE3|nr:hypothetical protein T310_4544 [Rasamsonia emersonii CBS 393.64]KKA21423.1 hypothetical protein T310_4544 [Rasamsonia emersonii CBS 393.64]
MEKSNENSKDVELALPTQNGDNSVVQVLDWDLPQDPENPQNWPLGKKIYHTLCVAVYAFTITYMSSAYAPGATQLAEQLGVSETVSLLGVSLFCVGLSLGPVIAAPLSETFGRLIIYRLSLPISILFIIGSAVASDMASIAICRFFAGAFGSPALSVGGGTMADMWPPSLYGPTTVTFLLAPFLGPSLAPVIGGFVVERKGWRWLEWVSVFISAATCLAALGMRETYKKVLLQRRAKKRGHDTRSHHRIHPVAAIRAWMRDAMLRPLAMLVSEPIVLFFSLYIGFDFAVLYAFFASLQLVFKETYGFDSHETGLVFLSLAVGASLATVTSLLMDGLIYQKKRRQLENQGLKKVPPEYRLYPAMIGSVGVAGGLFWFAWTARPDIHWASAVVALVPFNWGNLCIFSSAIIYIVDCYGPKYGASALSANSFTRYIFAAAFPLFTIQSE